jgi:hypothetical protein
MVSFMANLVSKGLKGKHLISPEMEDKFSREDRYVLTRLNLMSKKEVPVASIQESEELV